MNYYSLIEIKRFEKLILYSILEEYNEQQNIWFNDFIIKIKPEDKKQLMILFNKIGKKYGARKQFFRDERKAHALPSAGVNFVDIDKNLRLYCLRINKKSVVLFNGGYKDAATAQESSISYHFEMANLMSDKINKAINEGRILINEDGSLASYLDELL